MEQSYSCMLHSHEQRGRTSALEWVSNMEQGLALLIKLPDMPQNEETYNSKNTIPQSDT